MLLCEDGSYYTGYTRDLASRIKQHQCGRGGRYTRMKRVERIVYVEWLNTRTDAMKREREIKQLTHKKKKELVNSKNNKL